MSKADNQEPYKIYISYVDEDLKTFQQLRSHLSLLQEEGLIEIRSKNLAPIGADKLKWRAENLKTSNMVLFLVSIELLINPEIKEVEMKIALKKQVESEDFKIIPILVRRCYWTITSLGKFSPLPKNKIPIALWEYTDDVLTQIVEEIHRLIGVSG